MRKNDSGVDYVYWDKQANKWRVYVKLFKKRWYLGLYSDIERVKEIKSLAEENAKISFDEWLRWYNAHKSTLPKGNACEDLTGQRFGRLVVLRNEHDRTMAFWYCKCDCGKVVKVAKNVLKKGIQVSCGCHLRDYVTRIFKERFGYVDGTCITHLKSKRLRKTNTSGVKGVTWNSKNNKWIAQITFRGKNHYLGSFESIEDAAKARKEAEERIFGPVLQTYGQYY